jgi:predicted outer membrane protein
MRLADGDSVAKDMDSDVRDSIVWRPPERRAGFVFAFQSGINTRPATGRWVWVLSLLIAIPVAQAANPHMSPQDRGWLAAAHQDNLAEIQSGNLAARKGHTEVVRQTGRMLARDHAALDAKLRRVSGQVGAELPRTPDAEQRDEMRRFESASGTDFDRTWIHDEADGHVKAIELTVREIQHASLPQVKQVAQSALPVLKKHLRTLREAAATSNGDQ